MKLVAIYWVDIVGNDDRSWLTMDEVKETTPCPMITVGYMIADSEANIVVASTRSLQTDDDAYGNVNAIPKACIREVVELCDQRPCKNNFGEKI